jgi:DNA-binding transcriptional LysR family regulator
LVLLWFLWSWRRDLNTKNPGHPKKLDLLAEGVDLAIRARPMEDSTLTARALFSTRLCLWASRDYVARKGAPRKPEDFAKHAIVGFLIRMHKLVQLWAGRRSFSLPVGGRIVCDDLESIRTYVLRGNGIGLLPETSGAAGGLVRILPEFATDSATVSLVYPAQKFVPPAVRAFISAAREYAAGIAERSAAETGQHREQQGCDEEEDGAIG